MLCFWIRSANLLFLSLSFWDIFHFLNFIVVLCVFKNIQRNYCPWINSCVNLFFFLFLSNFFDHSLLFFCMFRFFFAILRNVFLFLFLFFVFVYCIVLWVLCYWVKLPKKNKDLKIRKEKKTKFKLTFFFFCFC